MKTCPTCNRTYTDDAQTFCLNDGTVLTESPVQHETLLNSSSQSSDPGRTEVFSPTPRQTTPTSFTPPITAAQTPSFSPSPPFNFERPQVQPQENRSSKFWLGFGLGTLMTIILASAVALGFSLFGDDNTADDQANTNVSNANAKTASTPGKAASVTGRWSGAWEDTRAQKGKTTINFVEGANGVITGDENGVAVENGKRVGNVITWEQKNLQEGCVSYEVRMEVSEDGKTIDGTYTGKNTCENISVRGFYLNYKKQ